MNNGMVLALRFLHFRLTFCQNPTSHRRVGVVVTVAVFWLWWCVSVMVAVRRRGFCGLSLAAKGLRRGSGVDCFSGAVVGAIRRWKDEETTKGVYRNQWKVFPVIYKRERQEITWFVCCCG
ncbi:hypothetical protein HanIR_Chr06g0258351 [Helianthus annuus]|nr:hypothetical protein HanIR_Chr06g0258351 [Helianthus annuus]